MSRLNQTFQNFFIRLGSFFSVVFRGFSGFFSKIFGAIGKLSGFSESTKYVEAEQPSKDNKAKATTISSTVNDPTQTVNITATKFNNRKSRSTDMDYFLDMAQKVKKS